MVFYHKIHSGEKYWMHINDMKLCASLSLDIFEWIQYINTQKGNIMKTQQPLEKSKIAEEEEEEENAKFKFQKYKISLWTNVGNVGLLSETHTETNPHKLNGFFVCIVFVCEFFYVSRFIWEKYVTSYPWTEKTLFPWFGLDVSVSAWFIVNSTHVHEPAWN